MGNSVAVYNTAPVIQYRYSLIQYTDCIPCVIRKKYNTVYSIVHDIYKEHETFMAMTTLLLMYINRKRGQEVLIRSCILTYT